MHAWKIARCKLVSWKLWGISNQKFGFYAIFKCSLNQSKPGIFVIKQCFSEARLENDEEIFCIRKDIFGWKYLFEHKKNSPRRGVQWAFNAFHFPSHHWFSAEHSLLVTQLSNENTHQMIRNITNDNLSPQGIFLKMI